MSNGSRVCLVLAATLLAGTPLHAAGPAGVPSAEAAIRRACDSVGGLDAFRGLGILEIQVSSEEVTQDGHTSNWHTNLFFGAPGPIPGRFELPDTNVVAGDDGQGGWAVVAQRADARPSTTFMVKRSLATYLFPLLLPFSLTWGDVNVAEVTAATINGKPVWQLSVVMPHTFFDTSQIASNWKVDLDRETFAVVRVESPATDIGKGVTADGMRFSWHGVVKLGDVRFADELRLTGLDQEGREKTHTRLDHLKYRQIPAGEAAKLFANPIPPDQRPKPIKPQFPSVPPRKP
jgi:hypothetical protein